MTAMHSGGLASLRTNARCLSALHIVRAAHNKPACRREVVRNRHLFDASPSGHGSNADTIGF